MGGVEELRLEPKWRAFMKGKYNVGFTKVGCTGFDQNPTRIQESITRLRNNAEAAGQKFSQVNWSPN
jgi:hypothetical protein